MAALPANLGNNEQSEEPQKAIDAFADALEDTIFQKLTKLQEENEEKAVKIALLKLNILTDLHTSIEGYSNDLTLDLDELKRIYDAPYLQPLFLECGINSFEDFVTLLDAKKGIEYKPPLHRAVLNGVVVPVDHGTIAISLTEKAFDSLRESALVSDIVYEKKIDASFANRVVFYIRKNGEEKRCLATPDGVYITTEYAAPHLIEAARKAKAAYDTCPRENANEHNEKWKQYKFAQQEANTQIVQDVKTGKEYTEVDSTQFGDFSLSESDDNGHVVSLRVFGSDGSISRTTMATTKSTTQTSITEEADGSKSISETKPGRGKNKDKMQINVWQYDKNGKIVSEFLDGVQTIYEKDEKPYYRIYTALKNKAFMYDDKGEPFALYPDEKEINGELTHDQYLDFLAKQLNTPEKLAKYMELFMKYKFDNEVYGAIDKSSLPTTMKEMLRYPLYLLDLPTDTWQSASETLDRVEDDRYRGDCDDYSFFAKEILRRQGINALVGAVPGHAFTVWAEKRPDGTFDVYSLCTFGLNKNGEKRVDDSSKQSSDKGFSSVADGINVIMRQFLTHNEVDLARKLNSLVPVVQDYPITDELTILEIGDDGKRTFFDVPVEVLTNPRMYNNILDIRKLKGSGASVFVPKGKN